MMRSPLLLLVCLVAPLAGAASTYGQAASPTYDEEQQSYSLRHFKVDFSDRIPHMIQLIKQTKLPEFEVPAAKASENITLSTGVSLHGLSEWRRRWLEDVDWNEEHKAFNQFSHYEATIEGQRLHFVHEKSKDPDAIPIVLLHGWPGSVLEMFPVVDLLTGNKQHPGKTHHKNFHVVIPSLPGFGFSSPAANGWTTSDTARIIDTLMTKTLGYKQYAIHGTDWGCVVAFDLYDSFNATARALHLSFLPFFSLDIQQLAEQNITLQDHELKQVQRYVDWRDSGEGYLIEQSTKSNTIGLALQDNPVGQLAWIGEKLDSWSDPRRGTGPSLFTDAEIVRHVSWFYLTGSFASSSYIYQQNPNGFSTKYRKAKTDAPLLFSSFNHNRGFWPKQVVAKIGNLVYYKFSEFGGHFPGVDNPPALAADIMEIANHWRKG